MPIVLSLSSREAAVLNLFQDPNRWFDENGKDRPQFAALSSRQAVLEAALSPGFGTPDQLAAAAAALARRGLMSDIGGMLTPQGAFQGITTTLGNRVLAYIRG